MPERLSLDEISKEKGKRKFITVVSDLDKSSLLEVIDSHKSEEIIEVLKKKPLKLRENVKEVSVDMWGGFQKVITEVFPNALIVIDRFHVMKLVNKALNKLRLSLEQRRFEKWLVAARCLFPQTARTIAKYLDQICNYFINGTTSGVMEGLNNKIKLILRQSYGFKNFQLMREKLLACLFI